ncbi:Centromere protein X [Zea mays]|uniref:Centromere protein X n=1 Tax=Zea mays TaxID=4577 RepID=A0A3L6FX16_MAIZE|nr:Centromere protein X [Zea mays]
MDEGATTSDSSAAETFDPDLIHAIFKLVWRRRAGKGAGGGGSIEDIDAEVILCVLQRHRGEIGAQLYVHLTANATALKVSCELLRIFVTEAIQRSAFIAEAEDGAVIEPTHLERVLPQLLLDF